MSELTGIAVEDSQVLANGEHQGTDRMRPSDPTKQWTAVIRAFTDAKRVTQRTKLNIREKLAEKAEKAEKAEIAKIEASQLEYLMIVHAALVQQFNSYGIVLTLSAAVTSVAILQPPGSFDQGHMLTNSLVACFLMFSSVSFLLACTGLTAVIVGSASLFRPWFFPKPPSGSEEIEKIVKLGQGTDDHVVYDDIPTLGEIILDNLLRVRRLRVYLALSLGLCMVAFVCGAFAILGPETRNLYMAIGTTIGSGVVLAVETGFTLTGPTHPPKWLQDCGSFLVKVGLRRFHPGQFMIRSTSRNIRKTMTYPRTQPRT